MHCRGGASVLHACVRGGAHEPGPTPSYHPQLVAHVSANKVILRRWDEGSVREWSAISYPNQVRTGLGTGREAEVPPTPAGRCVAMNLCIDVLSIAP